ncbi:MAG: Hsp20/alpha crystallin family protein [Desulfurococcales archaeon]|nr:Hsp20/alpha crystallin family protein [Desulfurococcales archaeon]
MGGRMVRRRRRTIFDIFNDLIREVDEEFREFFEEFERIGEFSPEEFKGTGVRPFVYGFRVTIGPDGRPKIEEFGNVRKLGRTPKITEEIEPLVDVIDEGDKIRVVAEVPGVEKDNIKLRVSGRKLIIDASNGKKYHKEVELPSEVELKAAKARYRNGVLEVELPKTKGGEEFEIKVE